MEIGWGRGYNVIGEENPQELFPLNTIVVSESIASSLGLEDNQNVILQVKLE